MHELNQKPSIPTSQTLGKSHGSKILLFIFGAEVILIGVGSYVLEANKTQAPFANNVIAQPSPTPIDETANWKTYRNDFWNFEIKYPRNLTLYKEGWEYNSNTQWAVEWGSLSKKERGILSGGLPLPTQYSEFSKKLDEVGYYNIVIDIEIGPKMNLEYSDMEEPLTEKNFERRFRDPTKLKRSTLQGRPMFRYGDLTDYWIFDGNRLIRLVGFNSSSKVSDDYIDQILSTFQFSN